MDAYSDVSNGSTISVVSLFNALNNSSFVPKSSFRGIIYLSLILKSICLNTSYTNLLTEFEGRTVNYGLRFSPLINGPSAKGVGHKSKGKDKGP